VTNARLLTVAWVGLSILGALVFLRTFLVPGPGFDVYAYWSVDPLDPYATTMDFGAFHYAPPLAWPAFVIGQLPFEVVRLGWLAFSMATLIWLTGRWAIAWLAFLPVSWELFHGNVHLQMAALLCIGWSAWLPLAKPSAIVVTIADVAMRGWRATRLPIATVVVVCAVSIVLQPATWADWVRHLLTVSADAGGDARIPIPWLARLPFAAILSFLAWRLRRSWLLAPALVLSLPILWFHGLAILAAAPRLLAADRRGATEVTGSGSPVRLG
jgi:hypothetical protein